MLYRDYGKNLYRLTGEESSDAIFDALGGNSNANNSTSVTVSGSDISSGVDTSTSIVTTGSLQAGKKTYDNTVQGYILGMDPKDGFAKFFIGNSTNYMNWDGATLTIAGSITASTITGGTIQTATSGQRIRIVSASAVTPTQGANSLMLINASGNGILSFGSDLGSSQAILNISPTDTNQIALSVVNVVQETVQSMVVINVVEIGSSTSNALEVDNDGSGHAIFANATRTGKGIVLTKSGTAANAFEMTQSTNSIGISLTKSGTGAGEALNIQNAGTGSAILINQSANSASSVALQVTQNSTTNSGMTVTCTGSGTAVPAATITQNGPTGSALTLAQLTSVNTFATLGMNQSSHTSTHFDKMITMGGVGSNSLWLSDGTTPNGNLTGVQGDFLIGGPSGHPFWCGGGTTWTQI